MCAPSSRVTSGIVELFYRSGRAPALIPYMCVTVFGRVSLRPSSDSYRLRGGLFRDRFLRGG
jgi:hypothetical protein